MADMPGMAYPGPLRGGLVKGGASGGWKPTQGQPHSPGALLPSVHTSRGSLIQGFREAPWMVR